MISEQEMIDIARQKGLSDEEIMSIKQKAMSSSGGVLGMDKPKSFTEKLGMGAGNALSTIQQVYGGVKPKETDLQGDILKTIIGEKAKALYRDPLEKEDLESKIAARKAGLEMDEAGNVIGRKQDKDREEREARLREFEGRRQAGSLRKELIDNQYVKRFKEMNSAATGIDAILSDTISRPDLKSKNVGDQAIITLYNKILDPLSVVRESEYARTPEGQSLMNRIQGFAEKVKAGGSGLTDSDRIEVARAAMVLINNAGNLYNQEISSKEELASLYGVEPSLVTTGFSRFEPYDIDKQYLPQNTNQMVQQNQSEQSDPIIRTGTDKSTGRRVGMTKSGKVVPLGN